MIRRCEPCVYPGRPNLNSEVGLHLRILEGMFLPQPAYASTFAKASAYAMPTADETADKKATAVRKNAKNA